jgi:hypothetical protein
MKDNGIDYNNGHKYFAGPKPFVESLRGFWKKSELPYQVLHKKTSLPGAFKDGKLFTATTSVVKINDFSFNIEKLIRTLSKSLVHMMIKGTVQSILLNEDGTRVESARVTLPSGDNILIKTRYIAAAAGLGTRALLESIKAENQAQYFASEAAKLQNYWANHVICVRGRAEIIPVCSGIFQAFGLSIYGHELNTEETPLAFPNISDTILTPPPSSPAVPIYEESGSESESNHSEDQPPMPPTPPPEARPKYAMWYIYPATLKAMQYGAGSNPILWNSPATISKDIVGEAIRNLFDLCPRIRDMAHQLEWSVYCSYRQEYPESKGQFGLEIVEEFSSVSNLCVCMPSLFATSHVVVERLLEKIKCQLEGHTMPTSSPPLSDDHIFSKSPRSSELSRSMALLSGIEINVKKIEKKISEGTLKPTPREDTNNNTNINNNEDSQPPTTTNNNVNSNNFSEDRGMLSSVNSDSDLIILEEEITLLMLKDKMDEMRKQNALNNNNNDSSSSNNNNTNHDNNGSLLRSLNVNNVNRRNEESLSPKPWDRKYHPNETIAKLQKKFGAKTSYGQAESKKAGLPWMTWSQFSTAYPMPTRGHTRSHSNNV